MKKLIGCFAALLLTGCGASDRAGGTAGEAVMKGKTASEWIQQLKDPDPDKRKFATNILRDHAKTDLTVREDLLQNLKSGDSEIKIGVAGVFAAMGWDGEDALPALKIMYLDENKAVSSAAVEAIRKIDDRELPKIGVSRGQIAK